MPASFVLLLAAWVASPAWALPPACASLTESERARADALLAGLYIHDCCDQPLAACLEQQPRCRLADRMADNLCGRVAAGQEDADIRLAFQQRARTALPVGEPAQHGLEGAPVAGDPDAPIQLVAYSAPRGWHCARMVPGVHQAVTEGSLQGKVRFYFRPFPLRSNEHGKEAGLAFLAAHELGAFWELALHSYANFDDFSLEGQQRWFAQLGLDSAEMERIIADPATLEALKASKREGVELGVSATPTFFIDGHLYRGEMEVAELIDTLEELWERQAGLITAEEAP
jgi:protein-disulfide isomerase